MSRVKRAVLWAGTVAFSLFGLLLVIVGPEIEGRLVGAGCIVLFGGGGYLFLRTTRERPPPEPEVRTGRTDLLGMSEAGVEVALRTPFPQALAFGFALVIGMVLTIYGAITGAIVALVLGILNTLLFVYMTGAFLRRRETSQRVVLTETGIAYEHPIASLGVRWQDIEAVSLFTQNDVLHIGVEAPREAVIQRTGSRGLLRMGRALTGAALTIPAMTLRADPERFLDELDAYAADPSPLRDPERERGALERRLRAAPIGVERR